MYFFETEQAIREEVFALRNVADLEFPFTIGGCARDDGAICVIEQNDVDHLERSIRRIGFHYAGDSSITSALCEEHARDDDYTCEYNEDSYHEEETPGFLWQGIT